MQFLFEAIKLILIKNSIISLPKEVREKSARQADASDVMELAVSIIASPNVCPPSKLVGNET